MSEWITAEGPSPWKGLLAAASLLLCPATSIHACLLPARTSPKVLVQINLPFKCMGDTPLSEDHCCLALIIELFLICLVFISCLNSRLAMPASHDAFAVSPLTTSIRQHVLNKFRVQELKKQSKWAA